MHPETPDPQDAPLDEAVAEAAARWLARRDRGLSADEREELERWIANPCHAAELHRLETAWRRFDDVSASPELITMADELDRATAAAATGRTRVRWRIGWASAAAFAVIASVWWSITPGENTSEASPASPYRIIASTARVVTLDDGSTAAVRADGEIRPAFTANERRVELLRGEAHFTVMKNSARPFVVSVGGREVRAVGTAFNVRLEPERVEVLVTDGTVEIAERNKTRRPAGRAADRVVAGQRARFGRAGAVEAPVEVAIAAAAPSEMEQVLGWQSTRLVFNRTPLQDAVDAFNRHALEGSGVQLEIGDPVLSTRGIGGTFRAANVEGFARLLEQSGEVRAERRGNRIVLLPVQ